VEPGSKAGDTSRGSICDLLDIFDSREALGQRIKGLVSRRFTTTGANRWAVRLPQWAMVMEAWFAARDPAALKADFTRIDRKTHPYCADITLLHALVGRDRRGTAEKVSYHRPTHRDDLKPGLRADALKMDPRRLPRGICSPTQRPSAVPGPRPAQMNRGRPFSGVPEASLDYYGTVLVYTDRDDCGCLLKIHPGWGWPKRVCPSKR
jgi:hypothetical protein